MKKRNWVNLTSIVTITGIMLQPSASQALAAARDSQPTVLNFWINWGGEEAATVKKLASEFNKTHSSIQVKVLPSTTDQKILTAMTGGTPPDIGYSSGSGGPNAWAKAGALEPLDSYIKSSGMKLSDFPKALLDPGRYNGTIYSLPLITDTYMLFYNKKEFQQAGITKPPTTFEELQKDAWKLTKHGSNGYSRLGFVPDFPWMDQMILPAEFGAKFYNPATKQVTPDDPQNIAALQFERSFFSAPYHKTEVQKFESGFGKYASPADPFFNGQLAMTWNGEWWPVYIKTYSPNLDYGVAPMPYPAGHPELRNTAPTAPGMIFIPTGSQHKKEAWMFLNWLFEKEHLDQLAAGLGGLPTTYSSLNDPLLLKLNPALKPFVNLMQHGKVVTFPNLSFSNQYSNLLGTEEQKVLNLEETPQQAMAKVKAQIQPVANAAQGK